MPKNDDKRRKSQLERIFKRDKELCYLCLLAVPRNEASRDHIKSLWEGGSNKDSNIALAHRECHFLKEKYLLRRKSEIEKGTPLNQHRRGKARQARYKEQLRNGQITEEDFNRLYTTRKQDIRQLERVYIRDNAICGLCWKHVPREQASREHVIPLGQGGTNKDSNVILSHHGCNVAKNQYDNLKFKELRD